MPGTLLPVNYAALTEHPIAVLSARVAELEAENAMLTARLTAVAALVNYESPR